MSKMTSNGAVPVSLSRTNGTGHSFDAGAGEVVSASVVVAVESPELCMSVTDPSLLLLFTFYRQRRLAKHKITFTSRHNEDKVNLIWR
jgi:hypothetical protein